MYRASRSATCCSGQRRRRRRTPDRRRRQAGRAPAADRRRPAAADLALRRAHGPPGRARGLLARARSGSRSGRATARSRSPTPRSRSDPEFIAGHHGALGRQADAQPVRQAIPRASARTPRGRPTTRRTALTRRSTGSTTCRLPVHGARARRARSTRSRSPRSSSGSTPKGVTLNQADFILTLMSVFWDEGPHAARGVQPRSRDAVTRRRRRRSTTSSSRSPTSCCASRSALGFRRGRLEHVYSLLRGKDLETGEFSAERARSSSTGCRARRTTCSTSPTGTSSSRCSCAPASAAAAMITSAERDPVRVRLVADRPARLRRRPAPAPRGHRPLVLHGGAHRALHRLARDPGRGRPRPAARPAATPTSFVATLDQDRRRHAHRRLLADHAAQRARHVRRPKSRRSRLLRGAQHPRRATCCFSKMRVAELLDPAIKRSGGHRAPPPVPARLPQGARASSDIKRRQPDREHRARRVAGQHRDLRSLPGDLLARSTRRGTPMQNSSGCASGTLSPTAGSTWPTTSSFPPAPTHGEGRQGWVQPAEDGEQSRTTTSPTSTSLIAAGETDNVEFKSRLATTRTPASATRRSRW